MGGLYAREEGLPAAVHQAIYEHYQPGSLEDASPASVAGAVLSIADKMDSIVGAIGVGLQVSGSSDPFGLRRNAHGVCKVVLDRKLRFSFPLLLDRVLAIYGDRLTLGRAEVKAACLDFFAGRLRFILEKEGIPLRPRRRGPRSGRRPDRRRPRPRRGPGRPQVQPPVRAVHPHGQADQQHPEGHCRRPRSTPTSSSKRRSGISTRRSRSSAATPSR